MAVRTRVINHADGLRALAPAWWDLLDRAAAARPTQTPLWLLSWWSVFGASGGRELRTVVVETARGEVLGIVPMLRRWALRDGVVPVSTLELLGSGEDQADEICSEYIGAIVAGGYEEMVAGAVGELLCSERLGAWDELRLTAMDRDDPMVPLLARELGRRRATVEVRTTEECPYVALPSTWDDYVAGLGAHQRYFVRRTLRDLEAWAGPGGPVLRRASDPAELSHGWRLLQKLHEARWSGPGVFRSARFRRFHEMILPDLLAGKGGSLDLLWLEVRGDPVAALYNIVYRGHVSFYQAGRRLDVPRSARPGIAIQLLAIRRAIESGHRTYDFLGHADTYKQRLAPSHARQLVTLSAVAPTLRARASSDLRTAARRLVRMARELTA